MSNIQSDSRYAGLIAYRGQPSGQLYWSTRVPLDLPPADGDRYVTPIPGEFWDSFAYRVYQGTFGERATRLWWVICDLKDNNITNPLLPLDPSRPLRCPAPDRILLEVLQ